MYFLIIFSEVMLPSVIFKTFQLSKLPLDFFSRKYVTQSYFQVFSFFLVLFKRTSVFLSKYSKY